MKLTVLRSGYMSENKSNKPKEKKKKTSDYTASGTYNTKLMSDSKNKK